MKKLIVLGLIVLVSGCSQWTTMNEYIADPFKDKHDLQELERIIAHQKKQYHAEVDPWAGRVGEPGGCMAKNGPGGWGIPPHWIKCAGDTVPKTIISEDIPEFKPDSIDEKYFRFADLPQFEGFRFDDPDARKSGAPVLW